MFSAFTARARSIGKSVKNHAGIIKRKFTYFMPGYNPDPDPELYVVDTLNEMIDSVKKSENSNAIYSTALQVLKRIFKVFDGFGGGDFKYYLLHIKELNVPSYHDPEGKGITEPKKLGELLEYFCGYEFLKTHNDGHVGNSIYSLNLDKVVTTGRRIVEILSKNEDFKNFCTNIKVQKYNASRGEYYIDHDIRIFKVALLIHGGNVASFMDALIMDAMDGGSIGHYGKYKRTIKCWLSAFFSAETARIIQEIAKVDPRIKLDALNLPLDQFKDYPKRIAALAYIRPIPDVPRQKYDEHGTVLSVVKKIQYFYGLIHQNQYDCHVCFENFINARIGPDGPDGYDLGIQCPDETCHKRHPLCQGCVETIKNTNMEKNEERRIRQEEELEDKCPSCRRTLIEPMPNLIPQYLIELEQIQKQLDEASGAYAQFPRDECDVVGLLPPFMLTACDDFKRRSNIPIIKQQVDELLEELNKIQDGMKGIIKVKRGRSRSRSRSRSPNRGGAHKRTARVPRKQRKQRKQRKSRKQRK